jgi:uncharacterized protein YndB with AHSA1/START domain
MQDGQSQTARVSMLINSSSAMVYSAFVEPVELTRFWLSSADRPLAVEEAARWEFMVPGATTETTATNLVEGRAVAWKWLDATMVNIDLEEIGSTTAVTIIVKDFGSSALDQVDAALNACEGFAIVLCDLQTLLESGTSAGLVASRARLMQARAS